MLLLLAPVALVPTARPPRVLPSWPPPGADPEHTWVEGVSAGPLGRQPDRLFEYLFRRKLAAELGRDVPEPGFAGVIKLVQLLAVEKGADVSAGSLRVLVALFPDWPPVGAGRLLPPPLQLDATGRKGLLYWFEILFARPFPVFAGRMNAWVTWWAAQWLMGPWCADLRASNP